MFKRWPMVLAMVSALFVCMTTLCRADDYEQDRMKSIDGQLADVDWVGSTIVVRWTNVQSELDRETLFEVKPFVKITRGSQSIDFSDLNRGDNVTVTYTREPSGDYKLLSVQVLI